VVEFKTTDPAPRGQMTITISLAAGTDVLAVHDGLPPRAEHRNEAGPTPLGEKRELFYSIVGACVQCILEHKFQGRKMSAKP